MKMEPSALLGFFFPSYDPQKDGVFDEGAHGQISALPLDRSGCLLR